MKYIANLPMHTGFIRHPVHAHWPAQSHHVKAMLGLNNHTPLPAEGMPGRYIDNIWVWVTPKQKNRKAHRVMGLCPVCEESFAVGRLAQHSVIHKGDKKWQAR